MQERWIVSKVSLLTRIALAVMVLIAGSYGVKQAYGNHDHNSAIQIAGWARWNYSGYERKPIDGPHKTSDEYFAIMNTLGGLTEPDGSRACGRLLWEPSSRSDDPINTYGTSLALELLPYFTDECIGSQEGIYFEASGTTSYHFITVTKLANHPSNPVRGLEYGAPLANFEDGIEQMRQMGVRYYLAWTDQAIAKADSSPNLELVAEIPDLDGLEPTGWRAYEIKDWGLVAPLEYEPVVAETHAGTQAECFDIVWQNPNEPPPDLHNWECSVARWWKDGELLDHPWAQSGPEEWDRIDIDDLSADVTRTRLEPVEVTDVVQDEDSISFKVDKIGVPVAVRTSFFPNWKAHGAEGPYRLAPNMMVVIPTENEVSLTYDLTGVDWAGRLISLAGIVGLVFLCRWKGRYKYTAEAVSQPDDGEDVEVGTDMGADSAGAGEVGDGEVGDDEPPPPDRSEPEPALP